MKHKKLIILERLAGFIFMVLCVSCILMYGTVSGEVLERVVAVVNEEVILLSDLRREMLLMENSGDHKSAAETLDGMINRILILEEARKFRLDSSGESRESLIDLYVERKIKALIHIPLKQIEAHYHSNRETYGDREFYDIKEKIESALLESELKERIRTHTEELRERSHVRIQLDEKAWEER